MNQNNRTGNYNSNNKNNQAKKINGNQRFDGWKSFGSGTIERPRTTNNKTQYINSDNETTKTILLQEEEPIQPKTKTSHWSIRKEKPTASLYASQSSGKTAQLNFGQKSEDSNNVKVNPKHKPFHPTIESGELPTTEEETFNKLYLSRYIQELLDEYVFLCIERYDHTLNTALPGAYLVKNFIKKSKSEGFYFYEIDNALREIQSELITSIREEYHIINRVKIRASILDDIYYNGFIPTIKRRSHIKKILATNVEKNKLIIAGYILIIIFPISIPLLVVGYKKAIALKEVKDNNAKKMW